MFAETKGVSRTQAGAWVYVDEMAHRVANDYAAMLAMVSRSARLTDDRAARDALNVIAARLRATAATHRILRPPSDDQARRVDAEIERLCSGLSLSMLSERGIALSLMSAPVTLDARRAWLMCTIVSELIANACRHAFLLEKSGCAIGVDVRVVDGDVCCIVSDNGSAAATVSPGLGSRIVNALVAELGGCVLRSHGASGTIVVVTAPLGASDSSGAPDDPQ